MKKFSKFMLMFTIFITFTQFCFASDSKVAKFFNTLKRKRWNGRDLEEDRLLKEKRDSKKNKDCQTNPVDDSQVKTVKKSVSKEGRLTNCFSFDFQVGVADSGYSDISDDDL